MLDDNFIIFVSIKIKNMKTVKMLVVGGLIATMSAYAQDGGKQTPKKEETKSKPVSKQELTIKEKSSPIKHNTTNATEKEAKPAAEPKKHEEKKNAPQK